MNSIEKVKNLKQNQCIVDELLKEVQTHPCKDCGKCVFGYEGITQLEMILNDITNKKGRNGDKELMLELCDDMISQSLCEEGIDIAKACIEAITSNSDVFDEHIAKKACRAGVCKKFMTVHVIPSKCVGCTDCLEVCDDDAILGKKKFVHVIVNDECTLCGKCIEACEEDAIVWAGAEKPRCPKKPIPCKKK